MLRVLKPGRKLPWQSGISPKTILSLRAGAGHRTVWSFATPCARSPDAFRFASPGKLRGALAKAGAMSAIRRLLQFTIQASTSVEDFWTLRCEMSEKLREKLATLSREH